MADTFHDVYDYYRGKQVMITGGLGFLGSNLAHRLVELGAQVIIVDPLLPLYGGNYFNVADFRDKISINIADIRDAGAMNELVKNKDVIFHIGNQTSHVDSMTDPLLDVDINCRGNIIFLEAVRHHNPTARVVYAGTRAQYGKLEYIPVDEKHRPNPTDIYGANKQAAEEYHFIYHKAFGLHTTSLRINNSYGPRHQMKHNKYGILNWFIRLALDNAEMPIYGSGGQLRDYNYVDDVIEAFLIVGAREEANGQAYNLGSGEQISFLDLMKKVIEVTGSGRLTYIEWPQERAAIEVGDYVADTRKIRDTFGWEPKTSLDDGLKRTLEFYRQNKKHYW